MNRSALILFFILYTHFSIAQLARKVQFGARLEYVADKGISGCKVLKGALGTSAALLLKENDIITKIGDSTFQSVDAFINLFMQYIPDQEVKVTVIRDKKKNFWNFKKII
jgi:S1-C subfamily serine protease